MNLPLFSSSLICRLMPGIEQIANNLGCKVRNGFDSVFLVGAKGLAMVNKSELTDSGAYETIVEVQSKCKEVSNGM